jgi:hypothetical protein
MVNLPVELRATRSAAVLLVIFQVIGSAILVAASRSLTKKLIPVPAVVDGLTLVLGLIALVGLVIGTRHAFAMKLRMDEQGLTLWTLRGYVSVRFEEIRELYPVTIQAFHLVTDDGRRLRASTANNFEIETVWEAIAARIQPRLVAEYESRLAAGAAIQLGPVRLDRNGLEQKEHRVSWAEIEVAEDDEPFLLFFRRGEQRAALKLDWNIPNRFLLRELWQRKTASRRSAPSAMAKTPERALGPVDPELGALIEERIPSSLHRWVVTMVGAALILALTVGPLQVCPWPLWVLLGLAGFFYTRRTLGRGFQLYTQGVRTPGGAVRFDALEHVSLKRSGFDVHGIGVRYTHYESLEYDLVAAGRTVRLKTVEALRADERPPAVWDELARRITEPLVRKRQEELRRGGRWVLGDLVIEASRLCSTDGKLVLPMEEAEQVEVFFSQHIGVWRKGDPEDEPWAMFHTGREDAVVVPPLIQALRASEGGLKSGTSPR